MERMRLGRTNLEVSRLGFGALPIQRVSLQEAEYILRRAFDAGVNFFDTARMYTDSEEKIGAALAPVRKSIFLATKTRGGNGSEVTESLETSLRTLKTDYIDVFQAHNPSKVPTPGDGTGRYEAMQEAKKAGKVRFLGISAHSVHNAFTAVESGLYDTVQFPLSVLSTGRDLDLPGKCAAADVGFIAMKALAGGLVRDIPAAFAFIRSHSNVLPIWGIQRREELEEFLALEQKPPVWDEAMARNAESEREALGKHFCRGCGYCLPCPASIPVPLAARMGLMLRRSPETSYTTPEWREKMARVENCIECGECASRCPYELNPSELAKEGYVYYKAVLEKLDARAGK